MGKETIDLEIGGVKTGQPGNPVYEVIKKEDIEGAFRDGLAAAFEEIIAKIDILITLYAHTSPPALWVWDHTARWGYDMWW